MNEIRELHVFVQEVRSHAGRDVAPPIRRAAACAVLRNPHAGAAAADNLDEFVELSVRVGEVLAAEAVRALGSANPIAYGKAVVVGADGDLEQGAAMIHCRIGLAMRRVIGTGYALIPGNGKCGGPGTPLDIVLGGIDDGWHYDAMDTMQVQVPGAPRADEIVLAVAYATGRPNARIRGADEKTVRELVGRLRREGPAR